jgi:hypothetical protein
MPETSMLAVIAATSILIRLILWDNKTA